MARQSKAAIKAAKEAIVASALEDIEFVYGEVTDQDELTVRAMVLQGATALQIKEAIAISAVNQRVDLADKSRYAFGVIRNVLEDDEE